MNFHLGPGILWYGWILREKSGCSFHGLDWTHAEQWFVRKQNSLRARDAVVFRGAHRAWLLCFAPADLLCETVQITLCCSRALPWPSFLQTGDQGRHCSVPIKCCNGSLCFGLKQGHQCSGILSERHCFDKVTFFVMYFN